MVKVSNNSISVDVKEDLYKVKKVLKMKDIKFLTLVLKERKILQIIAFNY